MDYMITNQNRKVYLRLNDNGQPETCVKTAAHRFSDKKARNILNNLPKTMRKFHFIIVPMPNETDDELNNEVSVVNKVDHNVCNAVKKVAQATPTTIKNEHYVVPKTVTSWVERISEFNSLFVEAKHRKDELFDLLSDVDKELSNCLHMIEMTKWKNGCDGYKEYKKIKSILEKRRVIKDELSVVQSISSCNMENFSVNHVVDKLVNRDFTIREVDDCKLIL